MTMRSVRHVLAFLPMLLVGSVSAAGPSETSLFGVDGTPAAYIAEGSTIYLWTGKPVAYLVQDDDSGFHVYGFDGKHLGWYVDGVVRDHKGTAVGARKEYFRGDTKVEPIHGHKRVEPVKKVKVVPPARPDFQPLWSGAFLDEDDFFNPKTVQGSKQLVPRVGRLVGRPLESGLD